MRRMGIEPMRLAPRELESRSLTTRTSSLWVSGSIIMRNIMGLLEGTLGPTTLGGGRRFNFGKWVQGASWDLFALQTGPKKGCAHRESNPSLRCGKPQFYH